MIISTQTSNPPGLDISGPTQFRQRCSYKLEDLHLHPHRAPPASRQRARSPTTTEPGRIPKRQRPLLAPSNVDQVADEIATSCGVVEKISARTGWYVDHLKIHERSGKSFVHGGCGGDTYDKHVHRQDGKNKQRRETLLGSDGSHDEFYWWVDEVGDGCRG